MSTFDRACGVLRQFGFLRRATGSSHVGVMHQLVQRAVRDHLVMGDTDGIPPGWGLDMMETVESVLCARYHYRSDTNWDKEAIVGVQALSPCVERWCMVFWDMDKADEWSQRLRSACALRQKLGYLLLAIEGSAVSAEHHHAAVVTMQQNLNDGDHLDVAHAMTFLGNTLGDLGKYQEALKMQEQVLEMRKRLYPKGDHPDIAKADASLSVTLKALDRT